MSDEPIFEQPTFGETLTAAGKFIEAEGRVGDEARRMAAFVAGVEWVLARYIGLDYSPAAELTDQSETRP